MLGYSSLEGVSFADTQIEWENCTTAEEQAEAFKAYCKSRDLTIEGTFADGVTSFTTQVYQNLVNTLGLDINALQADIKKTTDSNGVTKFLFNASGISAMNRIFSQFLQDHELEVGDTVDDLDIYDGFYFTDRDGITVLCTVVTFANRNLYRAVINSSDITYFKKGSVYKYDGNYFINQFYSNNVSSPMTVYFNLYNSANVASDFPTTINYSRESMGTAKGTRIYMGDGNGSDLSYRLYSASYDTPLSSSNVGMFTIIYRNNNSKFYLGIVNNNYCNCIYELGSESDADGLIINLTTNNNIINNNNYTNNTYTTINNDGDVYNYDTDDEPDPDTPVTPPDPPTPDDPSGGTPPDDWDIELPDLSNTDWVIYGLEKKFPWDIPFNMMFILSLLNAEPITPHFEGTIDLKYCTWNYDLDLEPFDTIAGYVREFMFLSFIIGLMLMTKNLIWG